MPRSNCRWCKNIFADLSPQDGILAVSRRRAGGAECSCCMKYISQVRQGDFSTLAKREEQEKISESSSTKQEAWNRDVRANMQPPRKRSKKSDDAAEPSECSTLLEPEPCDDGDDEAVSHTTANKRKNIRGETMLGRCFKKAQFLEHHPQETKIIRGVVTIYKGVDVFLVNSETYPWRI